MPQKNDRVDFIRTDSFSGYFFTNVLWFDFFQRNFKTITRTEFFGHKWHKKFDRWDFFTYVLWFDFFKEI